MGCGPSSAGGAGRDGEVDEEVAARKRRKFRKGVDEEVADSLKQAVTSALTAYVQERRAAGAVVARTFEDRVLGLRVSVQKRADAARTAGPRAKDWTSIYVRFPLSPEKRKTPAPSRRSRRCGTTSRGSGRRTSSSS